MPLTTGIGTENDNQVAVFTTPTNSATIGHLPDSVPHKQPTLRETAKPHDAVPGSADGSNGLSPHEGIFDLLNHRVGPTYDELPRNSSPHNHSRSLRPDFGEHERSQNKLYEQCLYGEAWCGMVAFSASLPQADLDNYMARARDDTYLATKTLFRAQQVQNGLAAEQDRRDMRALLASRAAGMPAAVPREPKVGDWAKAPRADGNSAVQSLGPRIQTCTLSEDQTAPAVVSSSQQGGHSPRLAAQAAAADTAESWHSAPSTPRASKPVICTQDANALKATGTDDACTAPHVPHQVPAAPAEVAHAADGVHDARAPQTASVDLAPHDDAAQALASTPSAPPQLSQVPETGSADAEAAGEAPSSNRGMPATSGTASADSSCAQRAAKASAGSEGERAQDLTTVAGSPSICVDAPPSAGMASAQVPDHSGDDEQRGASNGASPTSLLACRVDDRRPVDQASGDDSSAAPADPSPDRGTHDPPVEHPSLGMQARPAELEPEQQPSGVDSDHDADALHAQTGAEVSDAQPSDVAQPPSALVSLEQPAQVAGENE